MLMNSQLHTEFLFAFFPFRFISSFSVALGLCYLFSYLWQRENANEKNKPAIQSRKGRGENEKKNGASECEKKTSERTNNFQMRFTD